MSKKTQQTYDLYLTGEFAADRQREQVLAQLASLFKRQPHQVAPLLAGNPHCIKRALSPAQLQGYQQALHAIGVLTSVRLAPPAAASDALMVSSEPLQLSPPGTPVLTEAERQRLPAPAIDTSAISVAAPGSLLTLPSTPVPLQSPDIDYLQLAEVGSQLGDAPLPLPGIDIDDLSGNLSLAPPGSAMDTLRRPAPPPQPDISHLKLR